MTQETSNSKESHTNTVTTARNVLRFSLQIQDINLHLQKAREKMRTRVTIGFGFPSDWLRKWREFF